MSDMISEISVLESTVNIFDTDKEYVIPLYQRAYAWEDKQLIQLIEDIEAISENKKNYYIGSLIVSEQNGRYEVVDGQQRLTSLYLLLSCLNIPVKNTLTFACRKKSNYTLRNIDEIIKERSNEIDTDNIDVGIQSGVSIIKRELAKMADQNEFIDKLSKVVVFRIKVPKHTDLNRYFEIMNTRGEQLEQHDILKADLMGFLNDRIDERVFAKIWDACSDMSGYVQMHFISNNNEERQKLFGQYWNELPSDSWSEYRESLKGNGDGGNDDGGNERSINDIINKGVQSGAEGTEDDADKRVRFESIIDFPFFLMHTLRVFVAINGIRHEDSSKDIVQGMLDDQKLKEAFDRVIDFGMIDKNPVRENKSEFAKKFAICLLRTRFIFDEYIVKREYANNTDGVWSIKSLKVSDASGKKKAHYINSQFISGDDNDNQNKIHTRVNVMIQSAMRVSYVSPKAMHWITEALIWLSVNDCEHTKNDIADFNSVVEQMAKKAVNNLFFDKCTDGVYMLGVNTPHIVFNYLDYLLWHDDQKKYDDFTFEFRNSVEHWYPQNPSEGTFDHWDEVDSFGNLCIIQRSINSRFSNMSPKAKKINFKNMIDKGSLKLRIMSDLTEKSFDKTADQRWKETVYKEHETQMIDLLKYHCKETERTDEKEKG